MAESAVIPPLTGWHEDAPTHPYYVCDVFTSTPLEGNQLGVFVDGRPFDDGQMARLARELNFAETVFLAPARAGADVAMRIFAPGVELPFAGHPVLGTAFVVGAALGLDRVALETGAGVIEVSLERRGGRIAFGRMRQPIPAWERFAREDELLAALGVRASSLPVELYRIGPTHAFVRLDSEEEVAALAPDMRALAGLGVAANCFAGAGARYKTRMFCPAAGVAEDAATGSAAGPLAIHLARHGQIAYGEEIEIRQGAEIGRPSVLYARASGEGERIESVEVGGVAVVVAEGRYRIARG